MALSEAEPFPDGWTSKLLAEEAHYLAATSDHPRGYLLRGVTAPPKPAECPSLTLDGRTIEVMVEGLTSTEGIVFVSLYLTNEGYPGEWQRAFATQQIPATGIMKLA